MITEVTLSSFWNREHYLVHPDLLCCRQDGRTLYATMYRGCVYTLTLSDDHTRLISFTDGQFRDAPHELAAQLFADVLMEELL